MAAKFGLHHLPEQLFIFCSVTWQPMSHLGELFVKLVHKMARRREGRRKEGKIGRASCRERV